MGVIAEMIVNITAKTEKFRKGIGNSRKLTDQFAKSAGRLGGVVQQLGGKLAAFTTPVGAVAVGVGSLTTAMTASIAVTRQMAREFDSLAKSARKLGLTTQGLQVLQFAGELEGIGPEKLATSIQRMAKKIGNAMRGVTEDTKIFEELLRLDVNALSLMEADQQFLQVAESISKMRTHTERLSATVKIFDSEGADLVRMLSLGNAGFAELRKELEATGNIINDQAVKRFEDLSDSTTRLSMAIKGLKTTLAVELAPPLTTTINDASALLRITNQLKSLGGGAGGFLMGQLGPSELGPLRKLKTIQDIRARISGMMGARGEAPAGAAATGFPSVSKGLQGVTIGGDQMSRLINANAGVLSGRLQRGATGAANMLGRAGNIGNVISGGVQMSGMRRQWRQWQAILGGFGGAGGDGGGFGFNQGIRSGSVEAQAARARARTDRSRVPEKQLGVQQQILSAIRGLHEAAVAATTPIIEEVTL